MAENSKIEWTEKTFNPWKGCMKVSAGCANCYAESLTKRWGGDFWGPGAKRIRTNEAYWRKPLAWQKKAAAAGKRVRVFCASLADVFEDNPDQPELNEWRRDLFALIDQTPNLDWMLLTKRPENIVPMLMGVFNLDATGESLAKMLLHMPNVWFGTSTEDQDAVDLRLPELVKVPCGTRFISAEPLLGPIDLTEFLYHDPDYVCCSGGGDGVGYCGCQGAKYAEPTEFIDLVIAGGESGPGARPMHPDWVRAMREHCEAAGVAFNFKQWGKWMPVDGWAQGRTGAVSLRQNGTIAGLSDRHYGTEAIMMPVGKKAAGRMLDGRTHDGKVSQL